MSTQQVNLKRLTRVVLTKVLTECTYLHIIQCVPSRQVHHPMKMFFPKGKGVKKLKCILLLSIYYHIKKKSRNVPNFQRSVFNKSHVLMFLLEPKIKCKVSVIGPCMYLSVDKISQIPIVRVTYFSQTQRIMRLYLNTFLIYPTFWLLSLFQGARQGTTLFSLS